MNRSIFLLIILALGLVPPAGAQGYSLTGNDFLRMCDGPFSNDVKKLMYASYEVKEFNQRYAIIVFSDNVPAGTLEVIVSR